MAHIRSNEKKIFFNSAANGFTDLLKEQVNAKPELLNIGNKNTNYSAIFYALKNHHLDATIFLNQKGQKINVDEIGRIVRSTKIPLKEFIFFTELSKSVILPENFNQWLFNTTKFKCFELI